MKSIFLGMTLLSLSAFTTTNESKDLEMVANAVHQFVKSVDQKDLKKTDQILHKDFRAVVNRQFGSEEVSVMNKSLYLSLLKDGEIGGGQRKVTIHSINLEGNNAVVKASFNGEKLMFYTFLQLVKEVSGDWKVISAMPRIEKK